MRKFTLYVVRWGIDGWGNSKPCSSCTKFLQEIGIGTIIYTTGDDTFYKKEKVKDLKTKHISSGMKTIIRKKLNS